MKSDIMNKILNFEVNFVPKYNLNRRKGTKIVLLALALSFIIVPIVVFIIYMFAVFG